MHIHGAQVAQREHGRVEAPRRAGLLGHAGQRLPRQHLHPLAAGGVDRVKRALLVVGHAVQQPARAGAPALSAGVKCTERRYARSPACAGRVGALRVTWQGLCIRPGARVSKRTAREWPRARARARAQLYKLTYSRRKQARSPGAWTHDRASSAALQPLSASAGASVQARWAAPAAGRVVGQAEAGGLARTQGYRPGADPGRACSSCTGSSSTCAPGPAPARRGARLVLRHARAARRARSPRPPCRAGRPGPPQACSWSAAPVHSALRSSTILQRLWRRAACASAPPTVQARGGPAHAPCGATQQSCASCARRRRIAVTPRGRAGAPAAAPASP